MFDFQAIAPVDAEKPKLIETVASREDPRRVR